MPAEIVVLGGGVGGTLTANLLARRLPATEAHIRVVDLDGRHAYQPGWLHLALDQADSRWLAKDLRHLVADDVDLLIDRATSISPDGHSVFLEREGAIYYDYLVVATGARLHPSVVPGLAEGTHHFYSLQGAERLREALRTFNGGRIVVGVAGLPYRCPPAPLEFTFLLAEALQRRGLADRAAITHLSPFAHALDVAGSAEILEPLLERRSIRLRTDSVVTGVDHADRTLSVSGGAELGFDLAIVVPPHRGAGVIVDSALAADDGWLPTDPETLQVIGVPDIFALGDCTDLAVSKAGSTAHFEAPVVAEHIAARVAGREPDPVQARYRGKVRCWLEVGGRKATMVGFDEDGPVRLRKPSRHMYAAKWLFNRAYWFTVPKGRF